LSKALTARRIDALGANRQHLTTLSTATPGTRLLPDSPFNVPQNIVVPKDRPAKPWIATELMRRSRPMPDVRAQTVVRPHYPPVRHLRVGDFDIETRLDPTRRHSFGSFSAIPRASARRRISE
jgi:hypothetical protein